MTTDQRTAKPTESLRGARGKILTQIIGVAAQFNKEASQARDYCVAEYATLRAARPDPSLRKERLLGMTIELMTAI